MAQIPFRFTGAADTSPKKRRGPPKSKSASTEDAEVPSVEPPGPRVFTVSELQRLLRQEIEQGHPPVLVTGEVSNMQVHARSGHAYFTLKDASATLRCVMWSEHLARSRFRPKDGQEILVRGKLTVYERNSAIQLSVVHVEPRGLGALQLEFQERVERLRALGLTSAARKRPIPPYPRCIGVVTSRSGAALRDVLRTILRRDPSAHVVLSFTSVQGRTAATEIAGALRRLDDLSTAEVIILARGGGSLEDLWCFNEEVVAMAVAECRVPVITGVGHETDTTIADLVADFRASTPTAAAEHATPVREIVRENWTALEARLHRAIRAQRTRSRHRLLEVEARLKDPTATLRRRAQVLDELSTRAERAVHAHIRRRTLGLSNLERRLMAKDPALRRKALDHRLSQLSARRDTAMTQRLFRERARLGVATGRLESLSPLGVLARGYALVQREDGRLLRDAAETAVGDRLTIRLFRGILRADVVEQVEEAPGPKRDPHESSHR